jgi:hypothetical protein
LLEVGTISETSGESKSMAKMTDAEWELYQLEGRHLREDQRTDAQKANDPKKMIGSRADLSDTERQILVTTECRDLLKSIRSMLLFFTILGVTGLVLGILRLLFGGR